MENEDEKIKKIIIGNKPIAQYIWAVMIAFSNGKEVVLSAIGKHVNTLERIARLVQDLSATPIIEAGRTTEVLPEKMDRMVATLCHLKRKRK